MDKVTEIQRNEIDKNDVEHRLPAARSKYPKVLPMTVHGYEIRYYRQSDGDIDLSVWDGPKGVAKLSISPVRYEDIKAYKVWSVALHTAYQGQQLGYELYKGLVTLMGINLVSVGSHSIGARKLWMRLSRDPKISAYGLDVGNRVVFKVRPDHKRNELKSATPGVKVYSDFDEEPVGLIIVKRGSLDDAKLADLLGRSSRAMKKSKPDVFGNKQHSPIDRS